MTHIHEKEKKEFCQACRLLYQAGLVTGVGGNLCIRVNEGFLLTPTGFSLRDLKPDNVSVLDEEESLLAGPLPTKDAAIHLNILQKRKDIRVSCHVHGAHIIAASSLMEPGDNTLPPITPGFVYFAYPLPMLPFLLPGSDELAAEVMKILGSGTGKALLLQNHGLITLGRDYAEVLNIAEEVEEAAHIYLLTQGKGRYLTQEEINKVKEL
ncbi:MAG: class II aldolase/adducin family protein [Deltaproteobacteria bacterium]|nr:class II aldolase/adducin family protein [Deltaproteobacteria bacterium]MBW1929430.1 class II aldolase/adducin family protein [Deltaproteobacteria bacterium]MBW2124200.1 class II aldolase/adducin family protein [Deltaproteobacteria bacterium]